MSEMSPEKKALELLPALREELGDAAIGVDDANLTKFLRWKPSVSRAAERFRHHLDWRSKYPFVFDGERPLLVGEDPELRRVLESEPIVAPEGLVGKDGSTVLVGRLRKNDMRDGRTAEDVVRMLVYTMDRALERESTKANGVTVFHDLKGLSTHNLDPRIPKILLPALVGNMPLRIRGIYILNAPLVFMAFFKVISLTFPSKLRARMHFVSDISKVYEVIDKDSLLEEHGGQCQHNSVKWVADQMERENGGDFDTLARCVSSKRASE